MKPVVCTLAGIAVVLTLAAGPASAQRTNPGASGGGGASGGATASGGGGGGGGTGGGGGSGGGAVAVPRGSASGGSYSAPSSSGSSASSGSPYGMAVGRTNPANGNSSYVREMYGSPGDRAVPRGARPNPGAPTLGQAVLRPNSPVHYPPGGGGDGWYGYYPAYGWGYGLGYWSYYDPYWWWGAPYFYDYGAYGYYSEQAGRGGLKLKVQPTNAEVYVDGYYTGTVDDFDGTFQKLELETGPHHVEIRALGYQTIAFDVRIEFDETVTYRGELQLISKR